jgi:hypothetical protein
MTTQDEADQQAQQIGEIRRDSTAEQLDEAFGRIAYEAFYSALENVLPPRAWEKDTLRMRAPWIAAAAAVRKAEQELVRGQS